MKFNCGNCGEIDCVIVDGYGYGDRLLEGVTFEVRRDDDGKYHAQVEEFSRDYFAQFNQQMYLNMIEEGMNTTEEFAICPTCGEEITINKIAPRPTLEVKMQPINAVLGGAFAGAFMTLPDEDVGERTRASIEEKEEEKEESSSTEGGDSGGGGANEDLDQPESEPEKDDDDSSDKDDDDSSDDSSDDSDDSSDDSSSDDSSSDES